MVQGSFGKANINAFIFSDYGLHTASTRGMTVLNRNYSDSPSTNGGATRAAGGAPVIRPSEIPPAPCHPKAKGPGHSMHSHKVPKIALHSLQNSSAQTGLLMIAFLVHGNVGYCFPGPSATFTLSNLVLTPF